MNDLISREAARSTLDDEITITGKSNAIAVMDYVRRVARRLEQLPAAKSKIGKWKYVKRWSTFECSLCGGGAIRNTFNYCPWCGAEMEDETDGDTH